MPSDDRRDGSDRTPSRPRSTHDSVTRDAGSDDARDGVLGDDRRTDPEALRAVVREEVRGVLREEVGRVARNALALLVGGVLGFGGFAALATGLTASGYGDVAVVAAVLALAAGAVLLLSTGWRLLSTGR